MVEKNTIRVHGDKIEALKNGSVLLNDKPITDIKDLEKVTNMLIKSCIGIVRS